MVSFWLLEVLLALAALLVASQYWYIARDRCLSPSLLVVAGMSLLAMAALVGAYRYTIDPGVNGLHRILSGLSGQLTFLLSGLALIWVALKPDLGYRSRPPAYVVLTVATAVAVLLMTDAGPAGRLLSMLGLGAWFATAIIGRLRGGLSTLPACLLACGPVLVVVASLLVGTSHVELLGMPRLNWFHLLLALAVLTLLCARPLFEQRRGENGW
ncbi:hypothetical protein [Microbulbifer sp. YPW16]|uniref:hypothetical protein n=1 Tax=Microbulbifer sp. YPW16 TaxID=2904242 RepID=UPI001E416DDD|nr:hypothetical protein [Microbulbifer sp. YPW16]UHQ56523.1 hypothetical protein LVE68_06000 [Microbulbifer sp. YPW16]